jgi:hypothetical protein
MGKEKWPGHMVLTGAFSVELPGIEPDLDRPDAVQNVREGRESPGSVGGGLGALAEAGAQVLLEGDDLGAELLGP